MKTAPENRQAPERLSIGRLLGKLNEVGKIYCLLNYLISKFLQKRKPHIRAHCSQSKKFGNLK